MTTRTIPEIAALARLMCNDAHQIELAEDAATTCSWLHACGYQGLVLLKDALQDETKSVPLVEDGLGLDLRNVSCFYLKQALKNYVEQNGRIFLRNVRHGLFLVPDSVEHNYAIGCPIDPSFAIGGIRTKNPYLEKLQMAHLHGVVIEDVVWNGLHGVSV